MYARKDCRSWVHFIARLVHDHSHESDLEELDEMQSLELTHPGLVCSITC